MTPRRGDETVREITAAGGKASFVAADLGDVDDVQWLASEVGDVDILINNAGIARFGPTAEFDVAGFDEMFASNVRAPFVLVAALAPGMAARGRGSIVSLSSMAGGVGLVGGAAYGATKASLEAMTRAWAVEYSASGVRVNAIAPGPVYTPAPQGRSSSALGETTPMGRASQPEEIAEVIAFLASPRASYITGATVAVDGGRTSRLAHVRSRHNPHAGQGRDAERFFEAVLTPLGIDQTSRTTTVSVWHDFAITVAGEDSLPTVGLHVGFVAPSREQVDAFWQAGVEAGYLDDGPPGPRLRYAADYYAAFLRDPDGNGIEAVHRDGPRRREGVIDHLTIRVADLGAATAFYLAAAASAGFELRRAMPASTTFTGDAGGSFSLVHGSPTQHLHMAFPGNEDAVRRFYDDLTTAGYRANGEPGERPQYHPGYYAAYVLDPDGNNIEVVDHHRS